MDKFENYFKMKLYIFGLCASYHLKNKIEGTPILKLAMVKRLHVKKILPKN